MTTIIKLKRGTTTPTTSDITTGEVAVDTSAQKLYINDSGTVKEIGGSSGAVNSFTNFAVSGQSTVEADSSTDTLNLEAAGLNSITTNASTDTITIGTPSGIPFTKRDGTSTSLDMNVEAGTLSTAVQNLYIPFTKEDGTSVTTLAMSS